MTNKNNQEPIVLKHEITEEYFYVLKYKDLGDGRFESINKRKATKEEIENYLNNKNLKRGYKNGKKIKYF